MANSAQGIARDLALGLLEQQWQPQHLSPSRADHPEALLELCLHESIALRESGRPELSLELLAAVQQTGLQSPWLLDNQARALVALGQRQAAADLWQRLAQHSDLGVAETARSMAALQEDTLRNALGSVCARVGWVPRHLNHGDDTPLIARVLQEIITARELNAAQLSHDLAATTLEQGWSDPWLRDNQARALVHLEREAEALAIWQELQSHPLEDLATAALEMVQLYSARVAQQELSRRCRSLVEQGQQAEAEALLVEALRSDPGAESVRDQLCKLLQPAGQDLLSQELQVREGQLAAHERLLEAMERQLSGPQR